MRVPLAAALALSLITGACSPGAEPQPTRRDDRAAAPVDALPAASAAANAAASVPASPPAAAAPVRTAAGDAAKGVRRCGWLSNPTPGNWWLTDAEDQWILGTQGADQAPGMDEMPDMSTAGWVETNGHYGYGCACVTIASDSQGNVTKIADASPKPLKQCRADRKLPKPE
ncbi:MAG TPA: DUF4087 domain-containing protein [Allosphingosinicella sp.]|jgi:hypothetical protein